MFHQNVIQRKDIPSIALSEIVGDKRSRNDHFISIQKSTTIRLIYKKKKTHEKKTIEFIF